MNDKYLMQLLSDNEKIILVTRRHWLFLLGQIAPELALILLVLVAVSAAWFTWIAAAALGYLLLILPLISLGRDFWFWQSHKHVVTNRRVIHMEGVFSKNVTDSSLEKVNDVKMEQSALGRIFDYGDIEVLYVNKYVGRFSKFMIMGREQCTALEFVCDVFGDGPCERQAVIGACASADLIEDYQ